MAFACHTGLFPSTLRNGFESIFQTMLKCLLSTADMEAKKSEDAAIKIQSSYRGFAARKEVEAMKAANSQDTVKSKGIAIHLIQYISL